MRDFSMAVSTANGSLGFGRWMLVIAGFGVSSALAGNGIISDMDRSIAYLSDKAALKAAYRAQPGVLTCQGGGGFLGISLHQSTLVVRPTGDGSVEALFAADQAVDSADCTLELTSPPRMLANSPTADASSCQQNCSVVGMDGHALTVEVDIAARGRQHPKAGRSTRVVYSQQ